MASYDLIVIGGGPAGYVAAIRATQLGKKAACVEMDRAGGTCLNWGCIPTKALLRNAELYQVMTHKAKEFGFSFDNLDYDWEKIIGRSRKVADKLAGGIEMLFKKNKVDYFRGEGRLKGPGQVTVVGKDGKEETLEGTSVMLATGCKSRPLPDLPFNGKSVISSKEAMVLEQQPKSMVIIGGGAIGVEFAYFYNAFGTEVTVVEMMDHLLPVEDTEVSQALEKSFKKQGIKALTKSKVTGTKDHGDSVELTIESADGKSETIKAEVCLVAIGVMPVLPDGADKVRLTDRGYIEVNDRYETSVRGVFATGDIIGAPWLAHTASFEGIQAVNGMFDPKYKPRRVTLFPGCTYCHPQVASIGLTERAAKEKGLDYRVGKFPFLASGKALAVGEAEGFVKLVIDNKHGEVLGAHIIGENATELIAELGLGMEMEMTWEDLETTIHAHPTLSEAVHEAAGQAFGHAIHI